MASKSVEQIQIKKQEIFKQEKPIDSPPRIELPKIESRFINEEKVDFKSMMKISKTSTESSASNNKIQLVSATIEEQKKRNHIDKPIAEIEESDSDEERKQNQT